MPETKTPGNRFDNETEHDPSQQFYDREFNGIAANHGEGADSSQEDENIQRLRDSEKQAGSEPKTPKQSPRDAEDNPYNYDDTPGKKANGGRFRSRRAKISLGLTGGGLVVFIISLILSSAMGIFINLKELTSDWSTKHSRHAHHLRTSKVKGIRYFTNPDSCGTVAIKCKFKSGISDKEITKLREAGFDIQDKDIKTSASGKTYLAQLRVEDKKGKPYVINNAAEFAEQYRTNPRVLAKFEKVASTRSLVWRGKQALKKLATFGVRRSAVLGTGAKNDEEMTKAFREEVYGDGEQGVDKVTDGSEDNPAEDDPNKDKQQALAGLDDAILEQIEDAKAGLVENGPDPNTIVFDPSQLDGSIDPADAARHALSSPGKTVVMGAVGSIDTGCVAYKYLARLSYLSKLMAAAALIKYAGIFAVAADAAKAGEITPAQAAFIGKILVRPSISPSSKGKTFSDSAGFTLITQGKVGNHNGIARFTNGTPTLKTIDRLKQMISFGGNAASFCKNQQTWWGQTLTFGAGIAASIGSLGIGTVVGALAKSSLAAVFFSVVGNYITPLILQYATGAIVPDPETDPEGGYGAGNALAAGMGAMGSQVGRSEGMRPITDDEFAAVNAQALRDTKLFAEVDELNGEVSSMSRVFEKLSITLLPITQSLASLNLFGAMSSSATIVANSQGQLLSPYTYAAQDNYRDELCTDEDYERMNLATDAFCNPIQTQLDADVLGAKYYPDATLDYLHNGGYISDDGTPNEEFQEFIDVCIDGSDPLVSNGAEAELVGAENTENCRSTEEKHQHFRFFIMDNDIDDSDKAAVNDTLGISEGGAGLNSGAGATFRIATFNVLGANHDDDCPGGGPKAGCLDQRPIEERWPARLHRSLDVMTSNKLDIVGLQEFDKPQFEAFMKPEYGGNIYDIYPKEPGGGQAASRNSIIWDKSKFDFVSGSTMKIKYFTRSLEDMVPVVKLASSDTGQQFYVLNTHDPAGADYAKERYDDALLHEAKIKELSSEGLPIFYTGDFNSGYSPRRSGNTTWGGPGGGIASVNERENLTYCIITREKTMWDALDAVAKKTGVCPTRMDKGGGPVDHIFFNTTVTAQNYDTAEAGRMRNGSDVHKTIWVDVTIPGTGSDETGGVGAGQWAWPVPKKWWESDRADFLGPHLADSGTWTSGVRRLATDISVPPDGTPVYAMLGGKVSQGDLGGHGLVISSEIQGGTLQIAYAHGPRTNQKASYASGERIMSIGCLGNCGGGHLHIDMSFTRGGVKKGVCAQDVFLALGAGKEPDLAALTAKAQPPCGRS